MLKIWNLFWRLRNLSTLCRLTSGSTFCEFDWKVKGPVSTVFRASVSKARFLLRGRGNWQWCRVSVALHPSIQETHSYVFWLLQLFFSFNESLGGLFFFFKVFQPLDVFFNIFELDVFSSDLCHEPCRGLALVLISKECRWIFVSKPGTLQYDKKQTRFSVALCFYL